MYFKSLSLNLLLQFLVLKIQPLKRVTLARVASTLRVYSLFKLMVEGG